MGFSGAAFFIVLFAIATVVAIKLQAVYNERRK
jgi:hypothetical protein